MILLDVGFLLGLSVMSERSVLDFAGGETTWGTALSIRFDILIVLSISVSSFDSASVKFQAHMDWATVKFGGCTLLLGQVLAAISHCGSLSIGFLGIVSQQVNEWSLSSNL